MKKQLLIATTCLSMSFAFGQNVGIGIATPNASAKLDVTSTNSGVLIPRLALTAANVSTPVTSPATSLLVYNTATAGTGVNAVTPGYYYWNGTQWVRMATDAWLVGGNTLSATGKLGTISNNHVDLISNNQVRGRLSNLGEFFIGTTATVLTGDLMNGQGNATFPFALNGYTSQNGTGVYGAVQGGTTNFAAVQGEYQGTGSNASGVRGSYMNNVGGTAFNAVATGVSGTTDGYTGSYKFGVMGSGGTSTRSGGIMGYDYGTMGALGYFASSGNDYAFYGFGGATLTGTAGGKMASSSAAVNNTIGIGLTGGFMGGYIQGDIYGTIFKGQRFGLYVDGLTYVNEPIVRLVDATTEKVPVYTSSAMNVEVSEKGRAQMTSGAAFVNFSEEFKKVMSDNLNDMVITITPMGNTNGVFVFDITSEGFSVKENNNGSSSVQFSWAATTSMKGGAVNNSPEIIANDFETKMDGLMINDGDPNATAQPVWWDGTNIRFDQPAVTKTPHDPNPGTIRGGATSNQ